MPNVEANEALDEHRGAIQLVTAAALGILEVINSRNMEMFCESCPLNATWF